jgi:hypothetical protein
MHSNTAAQNNSHIETIAHCCMRNGEGRTHSNMLNNAELGNDNLGAFGKQQQAAVGSTHNELLAPSVQALREEKSLHDAGVPQLKNKRNSNKGRPEFCAENAQIWALA